MRSPSKSGTRHGLARPLMLLAIFACVACLAESPAPEPVSRRLQGTWKGVVLGDKSETKYTIKVDGNSFYFHRDTNFWFETTIVLPENTKPQQLHATIKNTAKGQESSIGKLVVAIFKIEGEIMTLLAKGDGSDDLPQSMERTDDQGVTHYRLQKVVPAGVVPEKR